MKKILPIVAILSIISCSPKNEDIETIILNYSGDKSVYQYDRIETISLTPLQTDDNCLIGESPMIQITGDNLFIQHGSSQRIDRFNTHGAYLNQIGRIGRGPGEMNGAMSDWFLYDSNLIGVRFYGKKSFMLYDFAGDFVRDVSFDAPAFLAHGHESNFWLLMSSEAGSPRLISLSETGEKRKNLLLSEKTDIASAVLWWVFHQNNGKLYIGMPYNKAIYKAEQDTVALAFLIDAGKHDIPRDFYDDPYAAWEALNQKGYVTLYNFLESNDYYVIQVDIRGEEREDFLWGIKHKQEKEWFWSKMEAFTSEATEYPKAKLTEDNRLVLLIPPYVLKEQLPLMKNVANPQIVASLNGEDNPVLVEIKLK